MTYEIKYRKEEEMKDSGIEWLGKVPVDFRLKSLKHAYSFTTGSTPSSGDESYYSEGGYKWLTISDMKAKAIEDTSSYVSLKAIRDTRMRLNKKGSLVYSFKLSVGQVAFLNDNMYTNEAIATFDISNENSLKFLYYMAPIFIIKNANKNIYGAKLLNQNLINNAKILIPKLGQQQKISNFLDLKTAEFDSIISKKEDLIEKLEEAKKSLISEVVTGKVKILDGQLVERNLDEMKDSGLEWLGMIPKDWEVVKLKLINEVKDGTHDTPLYVNEDIKTYPLITSKNIVDGKLSFGDVKYISRRDHIKIIARSNVTKGDIIMPMIGTIGNPVIVNTSKEFSIKNVALFKESNIILNKFLYYLLESCIIDYQLKAYYRGGVQSFVSLDILRNLYVLKNNVDEQNIITNWLDVEISKLDSIITKTKLQIQKLKEAKQSLISEAVTGKIDLRDWEIREI